MHIVSKLCALPKCFKVKLQLIRSFAYRRVDHQVLVAQKRHKSSFFGIFMKQSEREYKIKDNLPDAYNLIYRNTMQNYMLSAQIISTASFVMVGCIFVTLSPDRANFQADFSAWTSNPAPVENELLIYITALCVFALLLQYTLRKMPVRIYNHPQQERYAFVYYGALPFTTKRAICGLDQIKKLPSIQQSIIPWHNSRYEVHNNSGAILVDNFFKSPAELNIMLGYQKRYVEEEEG